MTSIISTKTNFNKENIRILSVDFETGQIIIKKDNNNNYNTRTQIFAARFYTNTGFKEGIHLLSDSNFKNDEVKFIRQHSSCICQYCIYDCIRSTLKFI